MMKLLAAFAAMGAGFWLAIAVVPPTGPWPTLAIFAGALASAYISVPRPRKPPEETRWIALERLFWVTGHDRIRCRDPRIIWLGEGKR